MTRVSNPLPTTAVLAISCCLALAIGALEKPGLLLAPAAAESPEPPPSRLDIAALPNAFRLHQRVISGGQPDGEAGFRALQQLGVRTVISVDGAKPELSLARQFGLRYVHLPHGYDGISEQRAAELAKAVSVLPGPIYIHCHHGRHRSPAAAAVACILAGLIPPEAGPDLLQRAGTSKDYVGLHAAVAEARRRPELDTVDTVFPESVDVPPMATAMVHIERTFDNLKLIEKAAWSTPAAHPDLTPAHEALLLREQFTELLRTDEVGRRPRGFLELVEQSRAQAELLETQLAEGQADSSRTSAGRRRLSATLAALGSNCVRCHRAYRD